MDGSSSAIGIDQDGRAMCLRRSACSSGFVCGGKTFPPSLVWLHALCYSARKADTRMQREATLLLNLPHILCEACNRSKMIDRDPQHALLKLNSLYPCCCDTQPEGIGAERFFCAQLIGTVQPWFVLLLAATPLCDLQARHRHCCHTQVT